jgi:hypothetical protein
VVYHSDDAHPLGSGAGFAEDAAPNHECNFYYRMRALLERLLNATGLIGGVLNLRALFPFDHKVTSVSLVGKLLRFARINRIPTSIDARGRAHGRPRSRTRELGLRGSRVERRCPASV